MPKIDEDGICGSTYGTTDDGADWNTCFTYVVDTYDKPVMSCEYDDASPNNSAGKIINSLMHDLPDHMGWGSFIWEPAEDPSVNSASALFSMANKTFTTNANMTAYRTLAESYGLPVPFSSCP